MPSDAVSDDDAALLKQARSFLTSPDVRNSDETAKREFLRGKGLNEQQISGLLSEQLNSPADAPPIPPRTYPQPTPSKIPEFLVAVVKLSTWFVGSSGAVALLYYLFLLPRYNRSLQGRHTLKQQQSYQLKTVEEILPSLADSGVDVVKAFEDQKQTTLIELEKVPCEENGRPKICLRDLMRAAIAESKEKSLTSLEVREVIRNQFPYYQESDDEWQSQLLREISHKQYFTPGLPVEGEDDKVGLRSRYSLTPITSSSSTPPLEAGLTKLITALSSHRPLPQLAIAREESQTSLPSSSAQKTLQSVTEFTAYLSKHTYAMPSTFIAGFNAVGKDRSANVIEDEIRKEIRSLKGLVLNRRTFATTVTPRPSTLHRQESQDGSKDDSSPS